MANFEIFGCAKLRGGGKTLADFGERHRSSFVYCDSSGPDGLANILSQSVAIPLRELKSASWISVAAAGMIESGSTRHAEEGSCPIRVTWVCCRR